MNNILKNNKSVSENKDGNDMIRAKLDNLEKEEKKCNIFARQLQSIPCEGGNVLPDEKNTARILMLDRMSATNVVTFSLIEPRILMLDKKSVTDVMTFSLRRISACYQRTQQES